MPALPRLLSRLPVGGPRTRLTGRGRGLTVCGVVGVVVGVLGGIQPLVQVGALLVLTVVAGLAQVAFEAGAQRRGALRLSRSVHPPAVIVGREARVEVVVRSTSATLLARIGIAERAARELSGGRPLRARLRRSADTLGLTYTIRPSRRGRWAVGPLEVRHGDAFGVASRRGALGLRSLVAVRPDVVPLPLHESTLSDDHDRASVGARTPAPDDASLREYRTGDDLRRVHWRSSARRGHLLVRQDEQAGVRAATVLLDTPVDDAAMEWAVRLAASVAVGLADGGHRVRLVGGGGVSAVSGAATVSESVLDRSVDLTRAADEAERGRRLRAAVEEVAAHPDGRELMFAVVGAQDDSGLATLARAGAVGIGWAMVLSEQPAGDVRFQRTVEILRRLGWVVCGVEVGEPIMACWERLLHVENRSAVLT